MSDIAILIRDRKTKKIVRIRTSREVVKVRVCRICGRAHAGSAPVCRSA